MDLTLPAIPTVSRGPVSVSTPDQMAEISFGGGGQGHCSNVTVVHSRSNACGVEQGIRYRARRARRDPHPGVEGYKKGPGSHSR